jgi:hypothetical protein
MLSGRRHCGPHAGVAYGLASATQEPPTTRPEAQRASTLPRSKMQSASVRALERQQEGGRRDRAVLRPSCVVGSSRHTALPSSSLLARGARRSSTETPARPFRARAAAIPSSRASFRFPTTRCTALPILSSVMGRDRGSHRAARRRSGARGCRLRSADCTARRRSCALRAAYVNPAEAASGIPGTPASSPGNGRRVLDGLPVLGSASRSRRTLARRHRGRSRSAARSSLNPARPVRGGASPPPPS